MLSSEIQEFTYSITPTGAITVLRNGATYALESTQSLTVVRWVSGFNLKRYKENFTGDGTATTWQLTKNGGVIDADNKNTYDININGLLQSEIQEFTFNVTNTGSIEVLRNGSPYSLKTTHVMSVLWWIMC